MLTNNPITAEAYQQIYTALINRLGGEDYQAFYMPKAYERLVSYFMRNTNELINYVEYFDFIQETIDSIGKFNSLFERKQLSQNQANMWALAIVDCTLKTIDKPRTIVNRTDCVSHFFDFYPGLADSICSWLNSDKYVENDMDVVKEVRQYLIDLVDLVAQEAAVLNRNPLINYGKDELTKAISSLAIGS